MSAPSIQSPDRVPTPLPIIDNDHSSDEDYVPTKPRRTTTRAQTRRQQSQPDPSEFTCAQCGKVYRRRYILERHEAEEHIGTTCFWGNCSQTFETEQELNNHLIAHNNASSRGRKKSLTCNWPGCGSRYAFAETVARHIRQHNSNVLRLRSRVSH
ncbi:uncharacterized protein GGS22DRAFT_185244 [Annulohypoxylon maeteangense]|uniref:uncharacterized protein n=1 Tax=Annulohypoxylon maeteangense TaxID=1927788 RepID=UPI002008D90B|nr:uncharacterized protein GGS22DRAFT_185244 [Annulohypoxylon maeteangense]KAI0887864.1 hypothetical protein GGS22DRAFT_185244 [Annulohypoxylon maeteangense]